MYLLVRLRRHQFVQRQMTNSGFFFRQGDNAANDGYGFGYAMNGTEYLTVEANTAAGNDPSLCAGYQQTQT